MAAVNKFSGRELLIFLRHTRREHRIVLTISYYFPNAHENAVELILLNPFYVLLKILNVWQHRLNIHNIRVLFLKYPPDGSRE